jgi:hypothetical protein
MYNNYIENRKRMDRVFTGGLIIGLAGGLFIGLVLGFVFTSQYLLTALI